MAVEEARSIDDILTSSDEDKKDHMGPHSLWADDSVEVLEQESALSNSIGKEESPASVTFASPSSKKPS